MTTEPDPNTGGAVKSRRMKLSNTSDQTETNDKGPCLSLRLFAARNVLWAASCSLPRLLQPQHLPQHCGLCMECRGSQLQLSPHTKTGEVNKNRAIRNSHNLTSGLA